MYWYRTGRFGSKESRIITITAQIDLTIIYSTRAQYEYSILLVESRALKFKAMRVPLPYHSQNVR